MSQKHPHIYIELIIAASGKQNLILSKWKYDLHNYITGIITLNKHRSFIVNGKPDHIHAFIGLNPSKTICSLVDEIKINSANFINDKKLVDGKFEWQEGFGGFSHSQSEFDTVYEYILNQEKYHTYKTFKQEFI